ncbi:hypothetical protein D9758_016562 [Tetrapyrgos nigripes]|uniref:ubiquitinyl hydrolase 1 n=1 Tax=Tetrapyrgos nigripes TaxID=182062 RepID=A0A8H5FCJ2_9AGAR|nr:hypothetical protein D9758_016562 [Tetrapyrgos nigripes]
MSTTNTESVLGQELTPSQIYDLNQSLLNEATDVSRPLIDSLVPISHLRKEYENGSKAFVDQIDWLTEHGYTHIRRARGDGDCFYRALSFAYVEKYPDLTHLSTTPNLLESVGFQRLVFEDFYEVLEDLIKRVQAEPEEMREVLMESAFQNPEVSNSIVMYMRLLTSSHLRSHAPSYEPFLFHPETGLQLDVREFCEGWVEATGREADHVQITALSRALLIDVDVAYLDGRVRSSEEKVEFVKLRPREDPEFAPPATTTEATETTIKTPTEPIVLLYRPGHYDILVQGEKEKERGVQEGEGQAAEEAQAHEEKK